ncbi:MAG: HAD family phosphatase [Clostridia bacterium]|nr:HAD family phosphatase [Clostridia bacterium]
MIRAALFDMDGLLIDSEAVYARGVKAIMGDLGVYISDQALIRALGANRQATDAIFAEGNPGYDGDRLNEALGRYVREHGYDRAMPLKPYAAELLRSLHGRGTPCALVTSSPRSQAEKYLGGPGLLKFFSAMVTGDMKLASKPAPDVYLRAAELLSVPIGQCAVLEDSWNGLRAGRAAGAVTIMVPDLAPYGPGIADCCDHVCADLREAEAILCR